MTASPTISSVPSEASPATAAPALTGGASAAADRHARSALFAAVLGFFVVTLDAVVVNATLPTIRGDPGGGVAGLQWVVDGYTPMFAALLLTAGSLSACPRCSPARQSTPPAGRATALNPTRREEPP